MADSNYYDTLHVNRNASQAEIKQAYRRLVKIFHPDSNQETGDTEQIIRINAAYEVLRDADHREAYDAQLSRNQSYRSDRSTTVNRQPPPKQQQRPPTAQKHYSHPRPTGRAADEQLEKWLRQVYQPVNRLLCQIINSLEQEIEQLAADPFDDELLEQFQSYLNTCRDWLKQAHQAFRSLPNPPTVAGAAVHLYYCLNHVGDGIEELAYFPFNYDEHYLHMGQELFRIAAGLHCEAQISLDAIT